MLRAVGKSSGWTQRMIEYSRRLLHRDECLLGCFERMAGAAPCLRRRKPGLHGCRSIGIPSTVCKPGPQIGVLTQPG